MNVRSISLADRVFDKLEEDILSGVYAQGEFLTECRLSQELGVSRTPIREALNRLEQEHLIRESGKGIIVVGVGVQDFLDIYDIRIRIEGLAARRVAARINDEKTRALQEIIELQEFYASKLNYEKIKETDGQFHSLIYQFSDSVTLQDILTELHRKVQRFRKQSMSSGERRLQAISEHKLIVSAIAAGDEEQAERYAINHIENAKDNYLASIGGEK